MAWEKTYTELVDEWHRDSHMKAERPWPKSKKYESSRYSGDDKLDGKEIGVGTRVIISVSGGYREGIKGYMLCTVIDTDDEHDYWGSDTIFIVEVTAVSNEKLNHHINRLRVAQGTRSMFSSGYSIVEVGKAGWPNYIPSGK